MTLPIQEDIVVTKGIGVLGYMNNFLIGIQNISGHPVTCTGHFAPGTQETIELQDEETLRMRVDIGQCIRDRFMPYIQTDKDIKLRTLWAETG